MAVKFGSGIIRPLLTIQRVINMTFDAFVLDCDVTTKTCILQNTGAECSTDYVEFDIIMDNFLRLRSSPGCSAAIYRPCGTMSMPVVQSSSASNGDVCGVASAIACSVAGSVDNVGVIGGSSSGAQSFHHAIVHAGNLLSRPSSPPGGLAGTSLLHRHGFVGHHMTAPGLVLPHHPAAGPPVAPHHLLTAPFVAAAQSGQMNALTLAERLAGERKATCMLLVCAVKSCIVMSSADMPFKLWAG